MHAAYWSPIFWSMASRPASFAWTFSRMLEK